MDIELGISKSESMNSICNNSTENINQFNTSSSSYDSELNDESTIEIIKKNKIEKVINYSYHIVCHITIFSTFESIFFWYYIVKQENKLIRKQYESLNMVTNLICINTDLDLDPFYDYMREQRNDYNNNSSLKFTLLLNGFLYFLLFLYNIGFKYYGYKVFELNIKVLKEQFFILLFLFSYEYLFFQNVIYVYKPKDIFNYDKFLFTQCS